MSDSAPRGRRWIVLALLTALLAATAGLFFWAVEERQEMDEAYAMAEADLRLPLHVRTGRARAGEPVRRGTLIPAPATQREVREMVDFCATARRTDVPALREVALRAESPLAAANAVRALGRLRAVRGDAAAEALLRDPRPRVRAEAILALGESRDPSAAALLELFLTAAEADERLLALRALGRLGGDRAEAAVRRVAESPEATREERAFARSALGDASARR